VTLQSRPLHSRFGRRLLVLFVGCALLPIAVLAAVSYRYVKQQLSIQSESRLHQANKTLGLALLERLLLLDATLRNIPPAAIVELGRSGRPHTSRMRPAQAQDWQLNRMLALGLDLLTRRRFLALEFVADDGRRTAVFGALDQVPALDSAQRSYLDSGQPLVTAEHGAGSVTRVYMVRRLERGGLVHGALVGMISPEFLWGPFGEGLPSPTTQLTVYDDSGHVLHRSADTQARAEAPAMAASDERRVTAEWPLVLEDVFGAGDWNLTLSQSEAEVLAPMVDFTKTFLFVVAGSVLVELVLSTRQIRRSVLPLVDLREGTRRIAERDFGTRVTVASQDEFAELAASFNGMAMQLGRQFNALETAAEIDRAVLSATDVSAIAETVLARAGDIVPCDLVAVILVGADGTKSETCVVNDYERGGRQTARIELRSADVQALLRGPEIVECAAGPGVPSYLAPMAEMGAVSFIVLPISYQRQLSGIIVLGGRRSLTPPADDLLQVRRLADQAAVALANARMLDQVRTLAYFDSLTGLPNRLSYKERLTLELDRASRANKLVAAFFIDLDHFSRINDTLGHEIGDQLLREVAVRLKGCCREREDEVAAASATASPEVARLGGAEFTIIIPKHAEPGDAAKLARRILSSFAHPIRLAEHELFVNASIGIAVYPFDGEDIDTLLMHADTAMYKAKEQGGSSYQSYSRSMNATALQRLTLESDLRRALDREEFEVYYQPIVDVRTGATLGAEALLRWQHPELGLLLPSEFIPLAEENGLILPLGEWVLRTACAHNRAWQDAGLAGIRVGVNLSSRQLTRALPETVDRILESTGLEPRYLGLELTESVLIAHQKHGTEALHTLRAMGLHLSVDDFGTGYSSFGYVKHLPLDTLKIDRSFVRDIDTDPDNAAITTAIIAMGHALGLNVIAEGVETEGHIRLLRRQGCDEAQGYLFGRPQPEARFREMLPAAGPRSSGPQRVPAVLAAKRGR
jgi:diguanylate cyclase (GGDEF)-like protein